MQSLDISSSFLVCDKFMLQIQITLDVLDIYEMQIEWQKEFHFKMRKKMNLHCCTHQNTAWFVL